MELRHLQYFLTVAETGNATNAARRLFVAQSALSTQLSRLENELGCQLFVRSRQGMHLTAAGAALRPLASKILADVENTRAHMDAIRGLMRGRLRLGMVQVPPASMDLIGLIGTFHRQHPGVELVVQTGASMHLAHAVAEGELDLALVAIGKPDLPTSVDVSHLDEEPLVGIVSTSERLRRNQKRIAVADLVKRGPFIHYRAESGLRRAVTAAFDRAGVDVVAHLELDQVSDMLRLTALGVGVTIVPRSALSTTSQTAAAGYRSLELTDPKALHSISAITLGSPSPAAARFLELLDISAALITHFLDRE